MRSISQESVLALINIVIIYLDGGKEIVLCIFISDSNWVGDGSDLKDRAGIRTLNKLWETNCLKKNRWKVPHSFLPFSCLSTEWEIIDYSRALQDLESSQAKCQPKTSCVSKKTSQHAGMCKQEGHLQDIQSNPHALLQAQKASAKALSQYRDWFALKLERVCMKHAP